jgi:hypothetical protein
VHRSNERFLKPAHLARANASCRDGLITQRRFISLPSLALQEVGQFPGVTGRILAISAWGLAKIGAFGKVGPSGKTIAKPSSVISR